jgi:hypothetical protein
VRPVTLEEVIQPYTKYPKIIQNAILLAHTHPAFLALTRSTRKVLYALLTRASQQDGTQPIKARVDRLAAEAGVSDKTVQRALSFFREIQWMEQVDRRSEFGLFTHRLYRFTPALCDLVRLPVQRREGERPAETKMSDGAVYVDLTFKEDQRQISIRKHKGKPVELPPALEDAGTEFSIQPTGIAKLRGIARSAGHELEHIIAVAREYLQRAGATGNRAYRYLERMAGKPSQCIDYAARALQARRAAASQAQAVDARTLADRCRNKRFIGPAGLMVRVFENTAEAVQDGVYTSIPYADLHRVHALVQAGTLREAEPGLPAGPGLFPKVIPPTRVGGAKPLQAAPSCGVPGTGLSEPEKPTSGRASHLACMRAIVGLRKRTGADSAHGLSACPA